MFRWLPLLLGLAACTMQAEVPVATYDGQAIYSRACARCHDNGLDGAQKIGDKKGWQSRLSQGMDVLIERSVRGFDGAVGHMPPRGDDPSLSDQEVAAAVHYLVEQSR